MSFQRPTTIILDMNIIAQHITLNEAIEKNEEIKPFSLKISQVKGEMLV